MIELYLSQVTETSESEQAGKYYARVSYKQTLSVGDMARHMAEHNTAFSEGLITGILIDFVRCVREQVLNGNTVKIDNLAIFKATVEANALETLYDAETDKVAQASIGTLPEGAKTGAAVKTIKLLAQSTGEFTRDELKKDVKLAWTDKTKADIADAKGDSPSPTPTQHVVTLGQTTDSTGGDSVTLSGAGNHAAGDSVTVAAEYDGPSGTNFDGWYDAASGGTKKSSNESYTFTMPDADVSLYAKYTS